MTHLRSALPARPARHLIDRLTLLLAFSAALLLTACQTPVSNAPPSPITPAAVVEAAAATSTHTPAAPATIAISAAPASPTPLATSTASPTPAATDTPTITPTPSETPLPTETPTSTPAPLPELVSILKPECSLGAGFPTFTPVPPVGPRPQVSGGYLDKIRLIGFYGSPEGRGLGILGNQFRNETARMINRVIHLYRPHMNDGRHVMPLFHMITTVAKDHPGPTGNYSYHVDKAIIYDWLVTADNHNAAVVLDIQVGRGDILEEFERIREFLYNPHVHLAIDPEFKVNDEQIPNRQIGTISGDEINLIQAEMEQIALAIGVNKILIIHQFKDSMVTDKQNIANYAHVELVIDGDGYGPPGPKIRNYNQYAQEPGFEYGGFKMFTDTVDCQLIYDSPFMPPQQVMQVLNPQPVIIIFQ